jgi:4-hydroxy-tetrahydrodipicolinate synthase
MIHNRLLPLMLANFVESNPGPVKAGMAEMGLIEEAYRLPLVAPKPESKEKIVKALMDLGVPELKSNRSGTGAYA